MKQVKLIAGSFVSLVLMTGCLQESPSAGGELSLAAMSVADAPKGLIISGPDIAVVGDTVSYSLSSASASAIVSSSWNFNDGKGAMASGASISYAPNAFGLITIEVSAVDSNGVTLTGTKRLNLIDFYDGLSCLPQTSLNVPAQGYVGTPVQVSAVIPSCFQSQVSGVIWNFGDGSQTVLGTSASHTFSSIGDYSVVMSVLSPLGQGDTFLTLERSIHISAAAPSPTPTPNPLACAADGATRESIVGADFIETKSCGVGGEREDKYKTKLTETCQLTEGQLLWTETSRTKVLQSEGECLKQSCKLPDGSLLADGQSRTTYSSQTPVGSCESVASTRTCTNGDLSGNSSASQMTCHAACEGFGAHGTKKTGVVIGTVEQPKQCAFGEEGYKDILQQVVDQTCTDGQVVNSNTRAGSGVTAGACPTYSYVGTDTWSACDANCGGKQNRVFECRDSKGAVAPNERCAGQMMPGETRLCDANPSAVARVDVSEKDEEAGSVGTCPKNQLGVVIQTRTTTTKTSYACVDHKVQMTGSVVSSTPWVNESYCRDYTAHRCSQDSLSNTDAQGRYEWMVKCQDQVPVIKEFLTEFDNVKASGNYTIDGQGRHVYPTFMNRATSPEMPWIAPKKSSASCDVPATAYVAAVCLSSCATPEQEILAQVSQHAKARRVPFLDAVQANLPAVATLRTEASLKSTQLKSTKVEQWVTEMMDTEHEILNFKTASGGLLRVTPNHPVIASDGSVRLASDFAVGQSLVKLGGAADKIVAIEHEKYFGKVYNLFVKSASLQENVVVTSGYLNGTAFFQNEGASNMNREILRKKLTRGALSQ